MACWRLTSALARAQEYRLSTSFSGYQPLFHATWLPKIPPYGFLNSRRAL